MCGIVGYCCPDRIHPRVLEEMVRMIRHRGPDETGMLRSGAFNGAMTRLAINGLSNGTQPLYSPDKNVAVFYNGEIYNYPELKTDLERKGYVFSTGSDGEVIAYLYEEFGTDLFEKLDGMFAIALWDNRLRRLFLARDIPGEKPLYYAHLSNGGLVYASEIQAFRVFQPLNLTINRQAVWDFPTFLWVPEPSTIFEEIKSLPRASYLEYDHGKVTVHSYKNKFNNFQVGGEDDWNVLVAKTRAVVERAVESRLLSDLPLGAFLSSGLDSSIVATLAQKRLGNLSTFSIGFLDDAADPYEGDADESAAAAEYAQIIGTKHHEVRVSSDDFLSALGVMVDHAGQPYAVSSGLGVLAIAEVAHRVGLKSLLSGDGADELFGGYSWYQFLHQRSNAALMSRDSNSVSDISMHSRGMSVGEILSELSKYAGAKQAWAWHYYASEDDKRNLFNSDAFSDCQSSLRHFEEFKPSSDWDAIDFIHQDRNFYLPYEMMVKLDRMTMSHAIEGRAPFVAPEVQSFVSGLSYDHMVRDGRLKPLLRDAFKDLLPSSVVSRPKHGFRVPIDNWLNGDWRELVAHTFSSSSALSKADFIDKASLERAEQMLSSKEKICGHTVFSYVILNMWMERALP